MLIGCLQSDVSPDSRVCVQGSTARTLAIFLVSYATCFAMAFAGDYPAEFGSWKVFFDRMHAAEGEPFTAVDVTNAITAVRHLRQIVSYIWGPFLTYFVLALSPHAVWDVLFLVPMLIEC